MISQLFRSIHNFLNYHFGALIAIMAVFLALWALAEYLLYRRPLAYKVFNRVMFAASIVLIIGSTLVHRTVTEYRVSVMPFTLLFQSFGDPILFMSMVLNVILFMPFGLFGCSTFRCLSGKPALIFIIAGVAFSALIEVAQYVFSIGRSEIDDVICNSLGLLLGYLFYRLHDRYIIKKIKEKK